MTDPAAIRATYADFRNVRTRQVCQIILEIPAEESEQALRFLGGVPIAGTEKWFAIARLSAAPKDKPDKRKWDDLPPATQAGIRCNEKSFTTFVIDKGFAPHDIDPALASDEDLARAGVLQYCGVESRATLSTDLNAGLKWQNMDTEYRDWLREAEIVP